jgi:Ni/Fe-hydrogenase subunit HybB-like protein
MTNATVSNSRNRGRLLIWLGLLVVLIGAGLWGAINFIGRSESASIPWGLLVPSYVFFSLAAAGSSLISSFSTVFGVKRLDPVAKRGILLSLSLLVPAMIFIILDLGKNSQALNMYLFFHGSSRLAWMGVLYMVFSILLFGQLVSALRKGYMSKWVMLSLSIAVLIATLAIETNLGALFGSLESRPLWDSPLLPLHFLVSAFTVGVALQMLFIIVSYRARGSSVPEVIKSIMVKDYRPLLTGLIVLNFVVIAVKFALESASVESAPYIRLLISGSYAGTFWGAEIFFGGVVPLAIMMLRKTRGSLRWLSWASALVAAGVFFSKYDLIIGGQSIGPTFLNQFIPYLPSVPEILTVAGGLAVGLLCYTVGELLLPLEPDARPSWFIFTSRRAVVAGGQSEPA